MEIERKFLINEYLMPDLNKLACKKLIQGYLSVNPVVRVRQEDDDYFLTYKGQGLMVREEHNLPLNKSSFNHLLEKCDGKIIKKTRYFYELDSSFDKLCGDNLIAEIDVFEADYKGLILLEIEFKTIEQANSFIMPDWFVEDVTNQVKYHNSSMI